MYATCFRVFANSNSPGPADNVYNSTGPGHAPDTGYVTANSPQPNPFPTIPINRVRFYVNLIKRLNSKNYKIIHAIVVESSSFI